MTPFVSKDPLKLLLFLGTTFIFAAGLTPILYNLGQFLAEITLNKSINPFIDFLGKEARLIDYGRVFNFSIFLAAALLLPVLLNSLSLKKTPSFVRGPWSFALPARAVASPNGQALSSSPHLFRNWFFGFFIAALSLFLTGLLLIGTHCFEWNSPRPALSPIFLHALKTGLLIALLEELLFRGIILGIFLRTFRPFTAILLVSLLFAALHFLQAPVGVSLSNTEHPLSGFHLLTLLLRRFLQPQSLLYSFAALTLVGMILGMARYLTASLWLPIGLHVGWVFAFETFSRLASRDPSLPQSLIPIIGNTISEGLLPLTALSIPGGLIWRIYRPHSQSQNPLTDAPVPQTSST